MSGDGEIALLARAHALFDADVARSIGESAALRGVPGEIRAAFGQSAGDLVRGFERGADERRADLAAARRVDEDLLRILAGAGRDHDSATRATAAVLAAARGDTVVPTDPIAAREQLRRRAARLRVQRNHVLTARLRARRRRAALAALRYRLRGRPGRSRRAEVAVRAALSRLGRPYVWGATGPDRFDCSGLVKWSYAQAGIPLRRTTYEQIADGIPVARSQVRPGDLVFPHTGHVQLAIGNGLVIEAPHAGATVQISPLGSAVAIRRPV